MAWRPTQYLVKGELDNTTPNKVVGWMKFRGKSEKVRFELEGNFHRDIRGAKIKITNDKYQSESVQQGRAYMDSFSTIQTGKVGDITRGLGEGADYVKYGYIEWYSKENGRVVIELESGQIELLSNPIPVMESYSIDREEQVSNMSDFIEDMINSLSGEGIDLSQN